jgi:hypothetical protein
MLVWISTASINLKFKNDDVLTTQLKNTEAESYATLVWSR